MFPVGDLQKSEVRKIATEKFAGLNILKKKESMGICFIGKRPLKEFLSQYINLTPGR
jgi:tRNA-specific 2-thiouridylase